MYALHMQLIQNLVFMVCMTLIRKIFQFQTFLGYMYTVCSYCTSYLGEGTLMGAGDLTAAVVGVDVVSDDSLPLEGPPPSGCCCCPTP